MDWSALEKVDWASVFSFVGLVVTPVIAYVSWSKKAKQERKAIHVALVAEVTALRDIARERRYVEELLDHAKWLRLLDKEERPATKFAVSIPDHIVASILPM